MERRLSIMLSLALGAAILVAPSLSNIGSESIYDSAFAAKGGNGKGNGKGGSKGASASKGSGNGADSQNTTNFASTVASKKQKTNAKQLALSDPTAPAHPSMLGRWNAAKPITHPAIQAHIRNGNFNGTIGMVAAYAQAQATYNGLEADLAAAQAVVAASDLVTLETNLATALTTAGYTDLTVYGTAGVVDPAVEAAKDAIEALAAAQEVIAQGEAALADLTLAEANMEAYSNRAPWIEIRDDVRARMGLDPVENDLVTVVPPLVPTVTP